MKTIINKFFLASAVVMSLTACSDFLDKEPLSQGTEAIVFKTPEHFEQAANALYNVIGWKNLDNKPSYGTYNKIYRKCVGWYFVAICSTVTVYCSYSVFGNLYEIFKIARYAIRKIKERT